MLKNPTSASLSGVPLLEHLPLWQEVSDLIQSCFSLFHMRQGTQVTFPRHRFTCILNTAWASTALQESRQHCSPSLRQQDNAGYEVLASALFPWRLAPRCMWCEDNVSTQILRSGKSIPPYAMPIHVAFQSLCLPSGTLNKLGGFTLRLDTTECQGAKQVMWQLSSMWILCDNATHFLSYTLTILPKLNLWGLEAWEQEREVCTGPALSQQYRDL